ncbi:hypothetical protein F5144DRAFT_564789 [Chaetomium tenue]|uniref:Uncharacterized protein n=1 Tax=Chaetomium tenue TaxID=1854479 RepID=A0ACB7PJH3_9PEZI|nr:hypothetical protein F5144DRAFT_564789 [Chaetomium globosum]
MSRNINPKTIMAPVAAFTMAGLLFFYTRSSIRTARHNAKISHQDHQRQQQQHGGERRR